MKIESAQMQLESSRTYSKKQEVHEKTQMWIGQNPENQPTFSILLDLSKEGLGLLEKDASIEVAEDPIAISPEEDDHYMSQKDKLKIRLIEHFLSVLTGKKVKLKLPRLDLKDPNTLRMHSLGNTGQQSAGWGLIYDRHESIREYEHTDFSAKGVIQTADGQEIQLQMNLHMERAYAEESHISIRAGNALKDPLVIQFDGSAAELSQEKFEFDLDLDGHPDQISLLKPGSGFLALDINNNGKIDDGSELFGPSTDSGFGELANYDSDENNWIDENDPIFNRLRVWLKDDAGNDHLVALGETGIGALYLGHIGTEFTLKQNTVQGKIKESSIGLMENGRPVTLQEIDLKL